MKLERSLMRHKVARYEREPNGVDRANDRAKHVALGRRRCLSRRAPGMSEPALP
jgi:hypothetical protein